MSKPLTIKFSDIYWKMPPAEMIMKYPTKLLQVFPIEKEDLSPEFLQYDTSIRTGGNYPIIDKILLVLFLTTGRYTWTTIRSFTIEKYEFYKQNTGKHFKIEINIKG